MDGAEFELSRISKLFVDRDQAEPDAALARRQNFRIALMCGSDVAGSRTLQLSVLTAARIATRCFPGAVRAAVSPNVANAPLLIWPARGLTFGAAVADVLGAAALTDPDDDVGSGACLLFGDLPARSNALRVTFDGWVAKVGPARTTDRLREREFCSLAGVLAAALALSELFLSFAGLSIEATRRTIGLSLWRPDLAIDHPDSLGPRLEYLPAALWVLGLGHLGNAYLWSLSTLPYKDPNAAEFFLFDYDRVIPENTETGILFSLADRRRLKTRATSDWLEGGGFRTRLVERRFDATFRVDRDDANKEPLLALCGFDSNPARRHIASAQFRRVIDSGLGGTSSNFDTIGFHTWPNPRPVDELWPDLDREQEVQRVAHQEKVARENAGYQKLGKDECGRYELAGKSVAVPFVGVTAASLVVAEALRLLHGGAAYNDIKLSLGMPKTLSARLAGEYTAADANGITFVTARNDL